MTELPIDQVHKYDGSGITAGIIDEVADHAEPTVPTVGLMNNETGEVLDEASMFDAVRGLDPALIVAEMKRRINRIIMPLSLFCYGSEFRAFCRDFEAEHGVRPETFDIGTVTLAIPKHWPDDPIWMVMQWPWAEEYWLDRGLHRASRHQVAQYADILMNAHAAKREFDSVALCGVRV